MQQQELRYIGSASFTIEDLESFYVGGSVLMAVIVFLPYLRRNRNFGSCYRKSTRCVWSVKAVSAADDNGAQISPLCGALRISSDLHCKGPKLGGMLSDHFRRTEMTTLIYSRCGSGIREVVLLRATLPLLSLGAVLLTAIGGIYKGILYFNIPGFYLMFLNHIFNKFGNNVAEFPGVGRNNFDHCVDHFLGIEPAFRFG